MNPVNRPVPAARLFCLPFAGGGPADFEDWPEIMAPRYEVFPLAFPKEIYRDPTSGRIAFPYLVRRMVTEISDHPARGPLALFGYGLGALIGFEAARILETEYRFPPLALFVFGSNAPHWIPCPSLLQSIPRTRERRGQWFRLQEDMDLHVTYSYRPAPPLSCPIHVFGGTEDTNTTIPGLKQWQMHTRYPMTLQMVRGDCSALLAGWKEIVAIVARELGRSLILARELKAEDDTTVERDPRLTWA